MAQVIPFAQRASVARWVKCVGDLKKAVYDRAGSDDDQDSAYMAEVGAWVVLLRIFPMALLRQFGGGGKRGARRLNRQLNLWDTGCYTTAAALPARPRAVRRSRQTAGAEVDEDGRERDALRRIHRQVTAKGRMGQLSRSRQALESHGLAPATEETLQHQRALHPKALVPPTCERHARLRERLDEAKKRHGRIELSEESVYHAVSTMPVSTSTWTPVTFLRAVVKSQAGLRSLQWLLQAIRNGDVPDEIRPLVLDGHLIGLAKESQHQRSSSETAAKAATTAAASGDAPAAADQSPAPARAPCLWSGESPDGSNLCSTNGGGWWPSS